MNAAQLLEMHTQKMSGNQHVTPVAPAADGAAGVASPCWYVAVVNHNSEVTSAEKLRAKGYEAFAATQRETRVWSNGRRHQVNRVVIGSALFVRCTESERREIVTLPYIFRFLPDKASTSSRVAVIPDSQIQMLRFMLGNADSPVEFVGRRYCVGERVRVARGRLVNCEGSIVRLPNGRGELVIALGALGGAKCAIPLADIQPLTDR